MRIAISCPFRIVVLLIGIVLFALPVGRSFAAESDQAVVSIVCAAGAPSPR